jgi:putative lipoic acid-binding regulatory protein
VTEESPLKFPTEFPVKIMGRDTPEFHAMVEEILARHVAPLHSLPVTRQPSKEGRFISVTVTINAQSREQLDALYRDLSAHELVLMAL